MAKSESKRFLFNCDWQDILCKLPDVSYIRVIKAVISYVQDGSVTELDLAESIAFDFIRKEIDWNGDKYEAICERRREAGRKGGLMGGAPKGNQNASKTKQNKAKQSKTKQNKDDNDNDNDNELLLPNGNMSNIDNLSTSSSEEDASSALQTKADAERSSRKQKTGERKTANAIIDYYNQRIKERGARLVTCTSRTDRRLQYIMARLDEYGEETVRRMIDKAVESRFLNYEANSAPMSIDWLMRPNNFPKVVDGNYDNQPRASRAGGGYMGEDRYIGMAHYEGEDDPSVWEREKEKTRKLKN